MKRNVGEFEGQIKYNLRKHHGMTCFSYFEWWTSGKRIQPVKDIIEKMWKTYPIAYREYVNCCVFRVNKSHDHCNRYVWQVWFGQMINPLLVEHLRQFDLWGYASTDVI